MEMVEGEEIDMDNETTKFCVSWFAMQIVNEATTMFISSWNSHPIPGMFSNNN